MRADLAERSAASSISKCAGKCWPFIIRPCLQAPDPLELDVGLMLLSSAPRGAKPFLASQGRPHRPSRGHQDCGSYRWAHATSCLDACRARRHRSQRAGRDSLARVAVRREQVRSRPCLRSPVSSVASLPSCESELTGAAPHPVYASIQDAPNGSQPLAQSFIRAYACRSQRRQHMSHAGQPKC